jgi:hypothetical protein
MFRKFVFAIAAACTLLFSSCQKDDDNDEPSGQEILTSGQWKITGATANPPLTIPGVGTISDIYNTPFVKACFKDNYYVFNANGTAEINEGATKCNDSDPQSDPTTWSLSADEKELTIDGNTFTVLELSTNKMRLNGSMPVQGVSISGEVTFTK